MQLLRTCTLAAALGSAALAAHATEALTNGGFESGTTGWTFSSGSGTAAITSSVANTGSLSAALTGNDASISQAFAAISVSSISSLSLMAMADGGAFDQVVFTYADGSTSTSTVFGLGDTGWTPYDLTSDLTAGASLVAITIYGALGQTNYIDDVSLTTASTVPEPQAALMWLAGIAGLTGLQLRRRRS